MCVSSTNAQVFEEYRYPSRIALSEKRNPEVQGSFPRRNSAIYSTIHTHADALLAALHTSESRSSTGATWQPETPTLPAVVHAQSTVAAHCAAGKLAKPSDVSVSRWCTAHVLLLPSTSHFAHRLAGTLARVACAFTSSPTQQYTPYLAPPACIECATGRSVLRRRGWHRYYGAYVSLVKSEGPLCSFDHHHCVENPPGSYPSMYDLRVYILPLRSATISASRKFAPTIARPTA